MFEFIVIYVIITQFYYHENNLNMYNFSRFRCGHVAQAKRKALMFVSF